MVSNEISPCANCHSDDVFRSVKPVSSGGGYAPNYLAGLGPNIFGAARFDVVVCRQCGLTRFFASKEARSKLSESAKWKRL